MSQTFLPLKRIGAIYGQNVNKWWIASSSSAYFHSCWLLSSLLRHVTSHARLLSSEWLTASVDWYCQRDSGDSSANNNIISALSGRWNSTAERDRLKREMGGDLQSKEGRGEDSLEEVMTDWKIFSFFPSSPAINSLLPSPPVIDSIILSFLPLLFLRRKSVCYSGLVPQGAN